MNEKFHKKSTEKVAVARLMCLTLNPSIFNRHVLEYYRITNIYTVHCAQSKTLEVLLLKGM